jgi:hypothetical protein
VVGPCGMRLLKLKLPVAVGGGLKVVTVKCYKLLAPFRLLFFLCSVFGPSEHLFACIHLVSRYYIIQGRGVPGAWYQSLNK